MSKKNAVKRQWVDLSVKSVGKSKILSELELQGTIDLVALRETQRVFDLIAEGKAKAKEGMAIMANAKVVNYRAAKSNSIVLGPVLSKMAGGSANFRPLVNWGDPKIAQAVELYYKGDAVLKDAAYVAEAKALIAQADVIMAAAHKAQDDAKALAGTFHLDWKAISA
jgi:hypothetical protein